MKTAVEWLVDYFSKYVDMNKHIEEIAQAKRMEKEQIIDAGNSCALKQHLHIDRINKMSIEELEQYNLEPSYTFGEEYYNETFIKNY